MARIKKDRPSNPVKKNQTPKYQDLYKAFRPIGEKRNTFNDVTGKGKTRGMLRMDDYGIYKNSRSKNKMDKA